MSFTWKEYLYLAKKLVKVPGPDPDVEAFARTAISRAYYSVYHRALFFIAESGEVVDRNEGLHDGVKKWFFKKGENSEDMRLIGVDFDRLKTARVEADYKEFSSKCRSSKAVQVIIDSEKLIQCIDALPRA